MYILQGNNSYSYNLHSPQVKVRTTYKRGGGSYFDCCGTFLSSDQEVCHSRTLTTISHGHHLLIKRWRIKVIKDHAPIITHYSYLSNFIKQSVLPLWNQSKTVITIILYFGSATQCQHFHPGLSGSEREDCAIRVQKSKH